MARRAVRKRPPVTIVEFSDLQCPHCKDAQPMIDKLLAEEPNARFVFQNIRCPSHNWAAKAAYYADCVGRSSKDAFWKFVQGTFDAQSSITESNADEKLTAIADASGVKGADMAACAAKPDTKSRVEQVGSAGTVGWCDGNADGVRQRSPHRERGGRASGSIERVGGVRGEAVAEPSRKRRASLAWTDEGVCPYAR